MSSTSFNAWYPRARDIMRNSVNAIPHFSESAKEGCQSLIRSGIERCKQLRLPTIQECTNALARISVRSLGIFSGFCLAGFSGEAAIALSIEISIPLSHIPYHPFAKKNLFPTNPFYSPAVLFIRATESIAGYLGCKTVQSIFNKCNDQLCPHFVNGLKTGAKFAAVMISSTPLRPYVYARNIDSLIALYEFGGPIKNL